MTDPSAGRKLSLQEAEYRLPIHWLLNKYGLAVYLRKTELMADMVRQFGRGGGAVLDLGCGDGRGTYELSRLLGASFTFTGIDFSERAIAFARLMAPDIVFDVQRGQNLTFEQDSFDLIVAREVIEHIPPQDLDLFLDEAWRVLKPNGKILLTTPSEQRRVVEKHFQHFSARRLIEILEAATFSVLRVKGFGWWPPYSFESAYRRLIGLPSLWRIQVLLGSHEIPLKKADSLIVLAEKK